MSSIGNNTVQQDNLRALSRSGAFTGLEKPLHDAKIPETLSELIAELHRVFELDHVNIEYVNHLLLSYKSKPAEWKKFAKFDRYRCVLFTHFHDIHCSYDFGRCRPPT